MPALFPVDCTREFRITSLSAAEFVIVTAPSTDVISPSTISALSPLSTLFEILIPPLDEDTCVSSILPLPELEILISPFCAAAEVPLVIEVPEPWTIPPFALRVMCWPALIFSLILRALAESSFIYPFVVLSSFDTVITPLSESGSVILVVKSIFSVALMEEVFISVSSPNRTTDFAASAETEFAEKLIELY